MLTMLEIPYILLYTIVFFLFKIWKSNKDTNEYIIPQPNLLLVLWDLLFKGMSPDSVISKVCHTYGKIVKLNLGNLKLIVLNDPKLIREAFKLDELSGRSPTKCFFVASEGKTGLVASDGKLWVEQRRFAYRNLKNFGFGKKTMESMIMDEVHDIVKILRKEEGHPVSIQKLFSLASLNSLWTLITGQRHSLDNSELNDMLEKTCGMFGESFVNPVFICFPSIAELFPNITGWKHFVDFSKSYRMISKNTIAEHKLTYNEASSRDLIDTYLQEINKCTDESSSFYRENGENNLVAVMGDLFVAGSETSSSALQWAILTLSRYQDVQKKFRNEIDRVVGKEKLPTLEDRPKMPYTEALIQELLRKHTIVPLGLMHYALNDADLCGYRIPKGSSILAHLEGVHNDSAVWKDPQNFRPERFIDENGQCIKKHDSFMPFSVGKRICIGETMARDTVFLFLTTIFQKFVVLPDPGVKEISLKPTIGFVLAPQPFKALFKERIEME